MMNKVQTFDQIIPCDFQLLTQCGGKSANSLTRITGTFTPGTTRVQADADGHPERRGDGKTRRLPRAHAWSWSTKGSKGILLPMEIETRPLINGSPGFITLAWSDQRAAERPLQR